VDAPSVSTVVDRLIELHHESHRGDAGEGADCLIKLLLVFRGHVTIIHTEVSVVNIKNVRDELVGTVTVKPTSG